MTEFFIVLDNSYIQYFISSERVQTATFVHPNAELMASAEQRYEALLDYYHIPFNLSGDNVYFPLCDAKLDAPNITCFNTSAEYLALADPLDFASPYNKIVRYEGMEHNIGTTGVYLLGQAFKYAVGIRENNITLKDQALLRIRQLIDAILFFYNITGRTFLPRWAFPNTTLARNLFHPYYYTPAYTGSHLIYPVYSNETQSWWYLYTGTSKDLYLGVLTGFAFVYLFCEDAEVRTKITSFVDETLTYFENTGWRFIDADGKSHDMGAELVDGAPLDDPIYLLAFLQVGRLVHYDRWNSLYLRYLYDRGFIEELGTHEKVGVYKLLMLTDTYFDINLQTKVAFLAAFFEPDSMIRSIYLGMLQDLSTIFHYHRNAYLDTMYLTALIPKNGTSILPSSNFTTYNQIELPAEALDYYRQDVSDCLMRYAIAKYPKRNFQNPILDYKTNVFFEPIDGNYSYYPEIGLFQPKEKNIYTDLINELFGDSTWINVSLPADMRATGTFIWEKSPFEPLAGGNGLWQSMPVDYLTPYWMARYLYSC